jgi:hypothetical protein
VAYAGNAVSATTANSLASGNAYTIAGLTNNGKYYMVKSTTVTVGSAGGSDQFELHNNFSGGVIMSFHRAGAYAINFGLDTDNIIRLGGWSNGTNTYRIQSDTGGNFTAQGNVTAYSDERLKKDWSFISSDFVAKLAEVKNGTYTRIDTGERQVGVSAQSLQSILPEAIMTDITGTLSISYGNAALAACVELAKELVKLKNELKELKQ